MSHVFSNKLREWHLTHGRRDLPWQKQGAYATWISEIMLQQTQVAVVIPYFNRFLNSFPTLKTLAMASEDNVLEHWAGLGYYSRARNLHSAAKQIYEHHQGQIPDRFEQLIALKGIGRSTAGAILSLGHGLFGVIQDGNVRRVLSRFFAIDGDLATTEKQRELWDLATQLTPRSETETAIHSQAIMDLGALVCSHKKPSCSQCPLASECAALRTNSVDRLPQAKAKRRKPEKHWIVLQLINPEGGSYFEKRRKSGIWGGLYAPPIGPNLSSLAHRYANESIFEAEHQSDLKHTFSHFSVILQHYQLRIHHSEIIKDGIWADAKTLNKGLPAPILKLLHWSME